MDDIDEEHPVWYPGTMNTRFQLPEDRFRLLFAEGEALKPSRHYSPIPGLTGQTVVALLLDGIPAPFLLDTLSGWVRMIGVYFDCTVDVTHIPTGKVLLKDHNLASGFNGVRVVSSSGPDAVAQAKEFKKRGVMKGPSNQRPSALRSITSVLPYIQDARQAIAALVQTFSITASSAKLLN